MQFSYVLPDPASYSDWQEFDADLACMKRAGYDAVELQIVDPGQLDEPRVRQSLDAVGYSISAFQTGATHAICGNCLCTKDTIVRHRTVELLRRFVDLAAQWKAVMVFGLLQGRSADEPDRAAARDRIEPVMRQLGQYAAECGATIAFEPINQSDAGFYNTIDEVADLVRRLHRPGLRMMIDTYQMAKTENDMLAPLAGIADILAHVHLCDTNHDVLGTGRWDTRAFLRELNRIGYQGHCSVGVYETPSTRQEAIARCMDVIRRERRPENVRPDTP